MARFRLPPGFRFHPTDDELVGYYLRRKLEQQQQKRRKPEDDDDYDDGVDDVIVEVDLLKCEPWDLPSKSCLERGEWYFFCARDKKYPNGSRANRATLKGYWKATGKDKVVRAAHGTGKQIGMKKTLVFYEGRAPRGQRTEWVMHEYRMEAEGSQKQPPHHGDYVLCRVFNKGLEDPPSPTNGSLTGASLTAAGALTAVAPGADGSAFGAAAGQDTDHQVASAVAAAGMDDFAVDGYVDLQGGSRWADAPDPPDPPETKTVPSSIFPTPVANHGSVPGADSRQDCSAVLEDSSAGGAVQSELVESASYSEGPSEMATVNEVEGPHAAGAWDSGYPAEVSMPLAEVESVLFDDILAAEGAGGFEHLLNSWEGERGVGQEWHGSGSAAAAVDEGVEPIDVISEEFAAFDAHGLPQTWHPQQHQQEHPYALPVADQFQNQHPQVASQSTAAASAVGPRNHPSSFSGERGPLRPVAADFAATLAGAGAGVAAQEGAVAGGGFTDMMDLGEFEELSRLAEAWEGVLLDHGYDLEHVAPGHNLEPFAPLPAAPLGVDALPPVHALNEDADEGSGEAEGVVEDLNRIPPGEVSGRGSNGHGSELVGELERSASATSGTGQRRNLESDLRQLVMRAQERQSQLHEQHPQQQQRHRLPLGLPDGAGREEVAVVGIQIRPRGARFSGHTSPGTHVGGVERRNQRLAGRRVRMQVARAPRNSEDDTILPAAIEEVYTLSDDEDQVEGVGASSPQWPNVAASPPAVEAEETLAVSSHGRVHASAGQEPPSLLPSQADASTGAGSGTEAAHATVVVGAAAGAVVVTHGRDSYSPLRTDPVAPHANTLTEVGMEVQATMDSLVAGHGTVVGVAAAAAVASGRVVEQSEDVDHDMNTHAHVSASLQHSDVMATNSGSGIEVDGSDHVVHAGDPVPVPVPGAMVHTGPPHAQAVEAPTHTASVAIVQLHQQRHVQQLLHMRPAAAAAAAAAWAGGTLIPMEVASAASPIGARLRDHQIMTTIAEGSPVGQSVPDSMAHSVLDDSFSAQQQQQQQQQQHQQHQQQQHQQQPATVQTLFADTSLCEELRSCDDRTIDKAVVFSCPPVPEAHAPPSASPPHRAAEAAVTSDVCTEAGAVTAMPALSSCARAMPIAEMAARSRRVNEYQRLLQAEKAALSSLLQDAVQQWSEDVVKTEDQRDIVMAKAWEQLRADSSASGVTDARMEAFRRLRRQQQDHQQQQGRPGGLVGGLLWLLEKMPAKPASAAEIPTGRLGPTRRKAAMEKHWVSFGQVDSSEARKVTKVSSAPSALSDLPHSCDKVSVLAAWQGGGEEDVVARGWQYRRRKVMQERLLTLKFFEIMCWVMVGAVSACIARTAGWLLGFV